MRPTKTPFDQRALLTTTAERAIRYYHELPDRPVSPFEDAVRRVDILDEPLPEQPLSPENVISLLDDVGSPASMAMAGPRFYGFVIGGALPAALAANWLAAAWDQATGVYDVTPFTARLEEVSLRWLLALLGLPADSGGSFVTGATMANFSALAAARHVLLEGQGWDVEADGLFGAPPITVIVGKEVHPSVTKALGLMGMGRARLLRVPTDAQGRLRVDALPEVAAPAIVCVQAGNVNSGAIDPIGEVCDRVRRPGVWVHVDGAFGLWAAASASLRHHLDGVEEADSWATDAHKWLNVPYDCGICLVRDAEALRQTMAISAAYLPPSERRDPSEYTPELSRRARGLEVWAAVKSLGRQGVAGLVDRCCAHARRFARGLEAAGFEILNDVVLNQVLVSFGGAETTRRVIEGVQREGTCWAGGTEWRGRTAMRISVCNWATSAQDVDRSVDAMVRIARSCGC